ncbi:MAG: O-antigen ligase family protein [Vicinamibacterales bacterium]|nr:O-antigen ligase family protein [Vicinamibacterales bacterium]
MIRFRPVLMWLFFGVLVTANVSKWFLDLGMRVPFHLPLLAILTLLVAMQVGLRRWSFPKPLFMLAVIKCAPVVAIVMTIPVMMVERQSDLWMFTKGLIHECIGTAGIIAILVFVASMDADERKRAVTLYLAAIALCSTFTVAEAIGAYGLGIDLDRIVTAFVPLWSGDPPSIDEDTWGFGGRMFYRFSGLTADPNLNAITFLLAIPILYAQEHRRWAVLRAGLAAVWFLIIFSSVSTTAVPLALVMVLALSAQHIRRSKRLVAVTVVSLFAVIAYFWNLESEAITHIIGIKLDPSGSLSSHLTIAGNSLALWLQHPMGVGPNNFAVYSSDFSTHNSYLGVLVETGPLGVVAIVAPFVYGLIICRRARTKLASAVALSLAALALSGMGHDVARRFEFQLVLFFLLAVVSMDSRPAPTQPSDLSLGARRSRGRLGARRDTWVAGVTSRHGSAFQRS